MWQSLLQKEKEQPMDQVCKCVRKLQSYKVQSKFQMLLNAQGFESTRYTFKYSFHNLNFSKTSKDFEI